MTVTTTPIRFTKLRSGAWGIRGLEREVVEGATVTVHRRDGSTSVVTVDRVIWSGDGVALAAITSDRQPRQPRPRRSNRGECYECGEWGPSGQPCRHCREGYHC